jgi:hypothetical protein
MKCSKVHKRIGLYREGELPPVHLEKLRKHLSQCKSCSELYSQFLANEKYIDAIRSSYTAPVNSEKITDGIMGKISDLQHRNQESDSTGIVHSFLNFIFLPVTQQISLACVILIMVLFGYQQFFVYARIANLEKQMAIAGKITMAVSERFDMKDCIQKSSHYLAIIKPMHKDIDISLQKDFIEDPSVMNHYASFFCSGGYKHFKKIWIKEQIKSSDYKDIQNIFSN